METSNIAGHLTRRFIAGGTLEEVLPVTRRLHAGGIQTSLDHLGENVSSVEDANQARATYEKALQSLSLLGLGATISVKLTQIGLDLGTDVCLENARRLARLAMDSGTRVEVDMESSEYTDRTLRIVEALHEETGSVRAVLQAYLHRTEADVERLNRLRIPIRLCKGAYDEPSTAAMPDKRDVDRNYLKLACRLLEQGTDSALATHDPAMLDGIIAHVKHQELPPTAFEFQMLYGVRRDLQERLCADGYRLRLYVPYGSAWYPYFMRRLAERPANVLFIAKNLLRA
jgi:proline dehydrogenase